MIAKIKARYVLPIIILCESSAKILLKSALLHNYAPKYSEKRPDELQIAHSDTTGDSYQGRI